MLQMFRRSLIRQRPGFAQSGFTLLEVTVVVVIIGILSAIAAPGWIAFIRQQRVNRQQQMLVNVLETAQRRAKLDKITYSVSFKTINRAPYYVLHPDTVKVKEISNPQWRSLATAPEEAPTVPPQGQVVMCTNLLANSNNYTRNNIAATVNCGANATDPVTITFSETGGLRSDIFPTPNLGTLGLGIVVAVPKANNYSEPVAGTRRCVIIRTLNGLIQSESGARCSL